MSERLLRHGASSRLNHPNLTDISQATDRPPTVLSPAPSTPLPFSPPSLSPPYCRYLLARSHPTSTNHPRIHRLPACLPVVPVSLFLTPSSSSWLGPRERRLRARVASPKTPQTPAGTRLHPVTLSSIAVIIVVVVLKGTSNIEKLGFRAEAIRHRRQREMPMVAMDIAGLCAAARDVRLMHFVSVSLRLSGTSETEDKTLVHQL